MALRTFTCVLAAMLASSLARAEPCPAAAVVSGDPTLAADVERILATHGVAAIDSDHCVVVRAEVSSRAGAIVVVQLLADDERSRERVVSQVATAAALIESWTRTDLASPIFELHAAPVREPTAVPAPAIVEGVPLPVRGIEAFGDFEASFADDRTGWLGMVVGVCIQVGTVCASARGRFSALIAGPEMWQHVERHSQDVLFGGDVPRKLGTTTVTFGFGAGIGATHTGFEEHSTMRGSETFGLRADAHVAVLIPLGKKLAIDVAATIDAAQVTDVEISSTNMRLADEPRILGRFGAGLRWGGR